MLYTQTKWSRVLLILLTLTVLLALPLSAAYPKHSDYVYDKNEVLSANTVSALKDTNTRLQSGRAVLIAVCVTDSTDGEKIDTYARELFTKWQIANGVLLVVDTGAGDYYAVQTKDIENVLTNEKLSEILNGYMEADFADGNIDRGVYKTILKLDEFLTAGLPAVQNGESAEIGSAAEEETETNEEEKEEASGFVKVLRVIFTILLVLIVLAVVLIGGLFVAALFNDTAMDLFQTYVMGMLFGKKVNTPARNTYAYDEDPYYDAPARRNNGSAKPRRQPYSEYDEYENYGAKRQNTAPRQQYGETYDRAPRQTNRRPPVQNEYYDDRTYNQPVRRQQNPQSGDGQYRGRNSKPRDYNDYR